MRTENWSSKKILVRLSWPLWLICGLYVEKLTRKSTVIEQWLPYTNWRGTQMRGLPIWAHLMLFRQRVLKWTRYGSLRCEHFGFSIQVAFSEVRKCDLRLFFFIKPYKHVISFHVNFWASSKLILTFTKRGWVACEPTSVHGPQCNFRLRNTTSVHDRQLLSTSAPPRYLIHCFQHEWAKMVIKLPKASRRMLSEKTSMITTNQTLCQCLASMTSVTLIKTAWRVMLMATTKHRTKLFK